MYQFEIFRFDPWNRDHVFDVQHIEQVGAVRFRRFAIGRMGALSLITGSQHLEITDAKKTFKKPA